MGQGKELASLRLTALSSLLNLKGKDMVADWKLLFLVLEDFGQLFAHLCNNTKKSRINETTYLSMFERMILNFKY